MKPPMSNTRTKKMRAVRMGVVLIPVFMLLIIYGCGNDRPGAAGDGQVNLGGERCVGDGTTRECHEVAASSPDGVRLCMHGTQLCSGGYWGACGAVGTKTLEGINLGLGSSALGTLTSAPQPQGALPGNVSPLTHGLPFPPTGFPACPGSAVPVAGNACDCTAASATCGIDCNSVASCNATSRVGKTAEFKCNSATGPCDFHCSPGSSCKIDCNSSNCNVTCPAGSLCDISCNSSTCNLACGLGACTVTTCNSSSCPVTPYPAAAADAGSCNVCDPYCLGTTTDAGLVLDASLDVASILPLASTPPGFEAKLIKDSSHCERYPSGSSGSSRASIACQADFFCRKHCDGPGCVNGKTCEKFPDVADPILGTHAGQVASGAMMSCQNVAPDLTLSSPCKIAATGSISVAVCNRGSGPVLAGQTVTLAVEPPGGILPVTGPLTVPLAADITNQTGCPAYPVACSFVLPANLVPGSCTRIDSTTCPGFSGNKVVMVNPNQAIAECALRSHLTDGPQARHGAAGSSPEGPFPNPTLVGEQDFQLGCGNNFHAWNSAQLPLCPFPYEPRVVTVQSAAVCPVGFKTQWNTLGWSSTLPAGTEILFEVSVRDRLDDGGVGAWTPFTLAGHARATKDPAICTMGATSGVPGDGICVKDLFTLLGPLQGTYEDLELKITMNPSVPLAVFAPTLSNYFLNYRCVPAE